MRTGDAIRPLVAYWHQAQVPCPIVVVGGGRWGRTWVKVIAGARATSTGISIAARTAPESVRQWLQTQEIVGSAQPVASLDEAMQLHPRPVAAIVASRPRDHVRDSLDALDRGLHVLVEKPISPAAVDGERLLVAARAAGRVLAIGTEFAFLPVLHAVAETLKEDLQGAVCLTLHWDDPAHEVRHGDAKTHHGETSVVIDLLAHAVSIFDILVPQTGVEVADVDLSTDGNVGHVVLRDGDGRRFVLLCDRTAAARRRELTIDVGSIHATVDFSSNPALVVIDGNPCRIPKDVLALDSTLRLELGAFLTEISGSVGTPISSQIPNHLRLQAQLENALG